MAATALTKNSAGPTGLTVNDKYGSADVTNGNTAQTGTGVFLLIKNTGSSATATLAYPGKYDGDQTVAGRAFTITATTGESVIPLRDVYRDPVTGLASITYSAGATLSVCVVAVP